MTLFILGLYKPFYYFILPNIYHVKKCLCICAGHLTDNQVAFADISQGPHTFAVVAKDHDGLVDRSDVHFKGKPHEMKHCAVFKTFSKIRQVPFMKLHIYPFWDRPHPPRFYE